MIVNFTSKREIKYRYLSFNCKHLNKKYEKAIIYITLLTNDRLWTA